MYNFPSYLVHKLREHNYICIGNAEPFSNILIYYNIIEDSF